MHETFGEDPYLCAALGVAYVRSLQGQDLSQGVMATGKHFLGYAVPLGGMNTASFEAGARSTRDLFAYPFEAAIQLAGLRSVMNSYSDIDGIPAGGSPEVLQDLLRDTLGFDGFVSSDYGSIERLVNQQQVAADAAQAGRLAIEAGLDVEMPNPFGYGDVLAAEVERGAVDVRHVDRCVRRVLRAKFEVGLFEHPYPTERIDIAAVAREGSDLSQELARRSIVLAKNSGLLPLSPGGLDVAVIGPHADAPSLQFPTYTYASWREANEAIIQGELGTMNGAEDTVTAWYETISDGQDAHSLVQDRYGARSLVAELGEHARSIRTEPGCALTRDLGDEAIQRAVAAAREADVVVLALGGASLWFTGERTEGEASDTADITLPGGPGPPGRGRRGHRDADGRRARPGPGVRPAGGHPGRGRDRDRALRRPVRQPVDRRRPVRDGEPLGQAAVQPAAAQRPDPRLPPPEGGLRATATHCRPASCSATWTWRPPRCGRSGTGSATAPSP